MSTLAGNFICKSSIGLQCRVLLLPWVKRSCTVVRNSNCRTNSSFPVRYKPKVTLKTEETMTSSAPMKVPVDELMNNHLNQKTSTFEVSNSFPAGYRPKKALKTEEPLTPPIPSKAPEDEVMNDVLSNKALSLEVSNSFPASYWPRKTLNTKGPQASSTPMKGPKDEVINNALNQKAFRFEVSNSFPVKYGPPNTSKTEEPQTSITMKGPEDELMNNDLKQKALGLEASKSSPNYYPKETSKTEGTLTFSTPMRGSEHEITESGLNQKALRFEVSNEGEHLQGFFFLDKKSENQIERPIQYLAYGTHKSKSGLPEQLHEVEEDIAYGKGSLEYECIEECENKVMSSGLNQNTLRVKISNGQKNFPRSIILEKKSLNCIQKSIQCLAYINQDKSSLPNVEKELGYNEGALEHECIEENEEVVEIPQNENTLLAGKTKQEAEKTAIELLATRAFTSVELRKKLNAKKFPVDVIDAVMIDFQSRGLINDCLYAETFSQSRWSSSSWGPRRIKQALFKKGVSEIDAEKAIKLVFQEGNSSDDDAPKFGLSKTSMDHLFVQASKQWLRGRDATNETRKARIVRWLQYRGFNWGVISFIVKKLESSEHTP